MLFPTWLASMVQVPSARSVTAEPDTVQTASVLEEKETPRPELVLATKVSGTEFKTCGGIAPNVMLCGTRFTVKLCVTADADA